MEFKEKYPILSLVRSPNDLRKFPKERLSNLCQELRKFLLDFVSFSSGHFASGLGTVELTIALHYVYNTPFDKLIWDTGHQAYPHKIITERIDRVTTIRKKGGLHPFPCREESEYDSLSVGHSSTSISAGLGMAVAAKEESMGRRVICVIGDGAITAGMAFEAINHAGDMRSDISIILNDNNMSISKNVGALQKYLSKISKNKLQTDPKKKKTKKISRMLDLEERSNINMNKLEKIKVSGIFFRKLGFDYIGPIDGHNVQKLVKVLQYLKSKKGPQLLHVITKKGFGYPPAEKDPITWHSVPSFNLKSNDFPKEREESLTYSKIFGNWLCDTAKKDNKLMAITPAMQEGSGMLQFSKKYPNQCFDVAIAEQHAVTFAAGLSIGGYRPVVAIYSTFLQRAYDQLIHDVAIQNLPILFAIDRGGIVGPDGRTHQGAFDLSFLRCVPNMIIMTPSDENECRLMLHTGYNYKKGPSAVRYPRGSITGTKLSELHEIPVGKGVIRFFGRKKIAILNFGTLFPYVANVAESLSATLVDMRFVKPLDEIMIDQLSIDHHFFVTVEENAIIGGAGSGVNEYVMKKKLGVLVLNIGLPDRFILQGNQEEIRSDLGLDESGIYRRIKNWLDFDL